MRRAGQRARISSQIIAGIYNTYYWLDPQKRVAGIILTQLLPFADHQTLKLYGEFEAAVYGALKAA